MPYSRMVRSALFSTKMANKKANCAISRTSPTRLFTFVQKGADEIAAHGRAMCRRSKWHSDATAHDYERSGRESSNRSALRSATASAGTHVRAGVQHGRPGGIERGWETVNMPDFPGRTVRSARLPSPRNPNLHELNGQQNGQHDPTGVSNCRSGRASQRPQPWTAKWCEERSLDRAGGVLGCPHTPWQQPEVLAAARGKARQTHRKRRPLGPVTGLSTPV